MLEGAEFVGTEEAFIGAFVGKEGVEGGGMEGLLVGGMEVEEAGRMEEGRWE